MEKDTEHWKGYDLDELKVRRIVNLTSIELEHMRLGKITDRYTKKSDSGGFRSILSKVMGAFDYVDYGIFAYQLGKRAFSLLRRRK